MSNGDLDKRRAQAQQLAQAELDSGKLTREQAYDLMMKAGRKGISLRLPEDPKYKIQMEGMQADMYGSMPEADPREEQEQAIIDALMGPAEWELPPEKARVPHDARTTTRGIKGMDPAYRDLDISERVTERGMGPREDEVFTAEAIDLRQIPTAVDEEGAVVEGMTDDQLVTMGEAPSKLYFQESDPAYGKTASNKRSVYREPMFAPPGQPIGILSGRPHVHVEPAWYRALDLKGLTEEQWEDLVEHHEDSSVYKEFADAVWKEVHDTHQKHGIPVIRRDYLDGDTFAQDYAQFMGDAAGNSLAFLSSIDDMVALGAARNALTTLEQAGQGVVNPALDELERKGVLPSANERVKDLQHYHPVSAFTGSVYGMAGPGKLVKGGAGARLMDWETKAMRTAEGKLRPFAQRATRGTGRAALGGGALSAGQETVEAVGREVRGEEQPTLGTVGKRIGGDMLLSGGTSLGADIIGSAGRAGFDRFRDPESVVGSLVSTMETAPGLEGKRATRLLMPLRESPVRQKARKEIAERHREGMRRRAGGERAGMDPEYPTDVIIKGVKDDMAKTLVAVDERAAGRLGRTNEQYYDAVGRDTYVDTEQLARKMYQLDQQASRIPFVDAPGIKEAFENLTIRVPKGGAALPSPDWKLVGSNAQEAVYVRKMNAEELDLALSGIDHKLREWANRAGGKNRALVEVQKELRKLYKQFPDHPVLGTQTMRVGGERMVGPAQARSWEQTKLDHHSILNRLEDRARAFTVQGKERIIDPKTGDMIGQEVDSLTAALRGSGAPGSGNRRQLMKEALKTRPHLQDALEEIAASSAVGGYKGAGGFRLTYGPARGVQPWGTTGLDRANLHFTDPIMGMMMGLRGKGGPAGLLLQENEPGTTAEEALRIMVKGGKLTYDMLQELLDAAGEIRKEERPR